MLANKGGVEEQFLQDEWVNVGEEKREEKGKRKGRREYLYRCSESKVQGGEGGRVQIPTIGNTPRSFRGIVVLL